MAKLSEKLANSEPLQASPPSQEDFAPVNSSAVQNKQTSSPPNKDATTSNVPDMESNVIGAEKHQPKKCVGLQVGWLDRFLALWIFLAMAVGIILGNFVPHTGPALEKGKFVGVSIPIAIGLLVMMYPILCKVRYEALHEILLHRGIWKQILFSIILNWIVAPFLMAMLPLMEMAV